MFTDMLEQHQGNFLVLLVGFADIVPLQSDSSLRKNYLLLKFHSRSIPLHFGMKSLQRPDIGPFQSSSMFEEMSVYSSAVLTS